MGILHHVFFSHAFSLAASGDLIAFLGHGAHPAQTTAWTAWWLAGAVGLILGSFLNVCISRLPRHQSIVLPSSRCPQCQAPIRPWDNVPLLSFFLLRGRCRACASPISWRYPLVEAGLAALFLACAARFSIGIAGLEAAILCFLLLGLLVMDLETFLLPNAFTWTGAALGLAQTLLPGHGIAARLALLADSPLHIPFAASPDWVFSAVAGLCAAGSLLLVRWLYRLVRQRDGLGLGDVKLAALLGCWLGGAGVALTLFLGILLGGLAGVAFLATHRGSGSVNPQTTRLPLGTFLCAAGILVLFTGRVILHRYFSFWP